MLEPCPSCGYCPTCGRRTLQPWQPYPPYYVPHLRDWGLKYWPWQDLPNYGGCEITCETTCNCPLDGTVSTTEEKSE